MLSRPRAASPRLRLALAAAVAGLVSLLVSLLLRDPGVQRTDHMRSGKREETRNVMEEPAQAGAAPAGRQEPVPPGPKVSPTSEAGPAVTVSLRFVDAAGAPVPAVEFKAIGTDSSVVAGQAKRDGTARATLRRGSSYHVVATADGRPHVCKPLRATADETVEIVFAAPASIDGDVATMDGAPLCGCVVTAVPLLPETKQALVLSQLVVSARTDPSGRFRLTGIDPTSPRYELRLPDAKDAAPVVCAPSAQDVRIRYSPKFLLVVRRGAHTGPLRWEVLAVPENAPLIPYPRRTRGVLPAGVAQVRTPAWPGASVVEFSTGPGAGRRTVTVRLPESGGVAIATDPGPNARNE